MKHGSPVFGAFFEAFGLFPLMLNLETQTFC